MMIGIYMVAKCRICSHVKKESQYYRQVTVAMADTRRWQVVVRNTFTFLAHHINTKCLLAVTYIGERPHNPVYCISITMSDSADEIDFSLSPVKKSTASQGRRAAGQKDIESPTFEMAGSPLKSRPMTGNILLEDVPRRPQASAPPRRAGGWGDETSRAKTAKSMFSQPIEEGPESDDDLPMIPDLEEVEQEDLALKIAEAPNLAVNRVATYKELDNDLLKHAAFATLEEIDLRMLTRCMAPEAALKESDEVWSWDMLFTDVSSEMQSEWFPESAEEKEKTPTERPYTAFNRFPV